MPARGVVIGHFIGNITEDGDTLVAPASPGVGAVNASLSNTMANDTLASAAAIGSQRVASLASTEATDTLASTVQITSPRSATLASTEATDTIAANASITALPQRQGAVAQNEANDTVVSNATAGALVTVNAALDLTLGKMQNDTLAATAGPLAGTVNASLAAPATEGADTLVSLCQTDNVINGVAIGAVGTGTLTNFKLLAGDDFIGPVKYWDVHTSPTTRMYAGFHFNGNRGQTEGASTALHFSVDPHWRGPRSAVPGGVNVDTTAVSNSVLTVTLKAPSDATLIANLPTTYLASIGNTGGKPAIQTAEIRTGPYFHYSGHGDWCIEAVYEVDAGQAIGYWGGPWETGTSFWPNFGEYDVGETTTNITTGVKTYDTGYHISDVDGGPDVSTTPLTLVDVPVNRPIWVRVIKTATKFEQYDDVAVQGTLALRNTYSNAARVARCRGSHQFRLSAFCDLAWHGGTFNPAQWPKVFRYHWWRVWGPSSGRDWVAPIDLGTTQVAANGSWAWTMPSPTAMYGAVPDYEEIIYTADGMDCPGIPGRNLTAVQNTGVTPPIILRMLGGTAYNATTRTWSGSVPSGEGGRIGFQCMGAFDAGGAARMAYKWFEVAPNEQPSLFADFAMAQGTPIATKTIVYADFHSGNLGPHVYTVTFTAGGAGLTITGSGTATVTISGTPSDALDATLTIVCTNAKSQSTTVTRFLDNTASVSIGGINLGAAGTGTLAGLKLVWGDDFTTRPTIYDHAHRSGRYMMNPTNGSRCNQPSSSTGSVMTSTDDVYYVDEYWRGWRNQSPTPLAAGSSTVSWTPGIASVTARAMDGTLLPYMPNYYTGGGGDANGQPHGISASMQTAPNFWVGGDGDWALEVYTKMPAGTWANGFWYSFWLATRIYPDFGEIDIMETYSNTMLTGSHLHISNFDGGPLVSTLTVPTRAIPTNRYCQYRLIKTGNTITFYDDTVTAGVLAQVGTYTDARVGRFRGGQNVRAIELLANCTVKGPPQIWTSSQWPKTVDTDWWRYWGPSAGDDYAAPNVLTDINTTPGGSWAATFPSQTVCYGHTVDREIYMQIFDNDDTPGRMAYVPNSFVPAGMTYTTATRTCSGTVPTTEGGRVAMALIGNMFIGGPARVCMQYWNVAPAVEPTLFANQTLSNGVAASITIAFTDFHSGNLGPHTYSISKFSGPTGLTVTMGASNWSATIAGTPTTNGAIVYDITATNAIGQTTTARRTLTVANVTASMSMNFVTDSYDYNGTAYSSWASALASGHWTFARALKAYYVDAAGVVTEPATGVLRRGTGGFRCEPARVNWCRLSKTMDITGAIQSYGAGLTSVPNNQTGPDGTANVADTHTITAASAQHYIGQNQTIAGNDYTAGLLYEHNVFIKKGTQRYVQICPPSGVLSGLGYMNCDFDTGATSIGGSGLISTMFKSLGSGWYWAGVTFQATATASNGCIQVAAILDMSATRNPTWTPGATATFYTWQCHMSDANKLTLPIDNPANTGTTAAPSRPADALGIVLPAGTWNIRATFMDNTDQVFTGATGTWVLPAHALDQFDIKTIAMETSSFTSGAYTFSSTGGLPSGWSQTFVTSDITITEASGYMTSVVTVNGRHGLQWNTPGTSLTNVEVLVKMRSNRHVDGDSGPYVFVRGSGTAGAENCYRFAAGYTVASGVAGFVGASKVVAGAATSYTVFPVMPWAAGDWLWYRVRAIGTELSVKVWQDGSAEPGSWTIVWTDNSVASGSIGVMPFQAGLTCDVDYFSYALGGATAS